MSQSANLHSLDGNGSEPDWCFAVGLNDAADAMHVVGTGRGVGRVGRHMGRAANRKNTVQSIVCGYA